MKYLPPWPGDGPEPPSLDKLKLAAGLLEKDSLVLDQNKALRLRPRVEYWWKVATYWECRTWEEDLGNSSMVSRTYLQEALDQVDTLVGVVNRLHPYRNCLWVGYAECVYLHAQVCDPYSYGECSEVFE